MGTWARLPALGCLLVCVAARDRALQEMRGCGSDDRSWRGPAGETCFGVECSVAGAVEHCRGTCCGEDSRDVFRLSACEPVLCGVDAAIQNFLRGKGTDVEPLEEEGCKPHSIYNHVTRRNETVHLKCRDCVPRLCAKGEHDCVPVYCNATTTDEDRRAQEELEIASDPCLGGHHDDDGLAWWPFLLACLVSTVVVTTALQKLSNGACCGKSINPPFTVVMFFFGYYVSHLCVDATSDGDGGHADEHHGVILRTQYLAQLHSDVFDSCLHAYVTYILYGAATWHSV